MMYWVVVALGAIPAALFLYSRYVSQKPQIYVKVGTKWAETLRKIPVFEETYTPTWWCPFGWAQTIVREIFRDLPRLDWEREIMRYPDGGQSALDWLHPKDEQLREDTTTPIVVFLPGITGSTHTAAYLLHAAVEVHARGWRAVVANGRGAGGVELLTPRLYNAGTEEATEDLGEVLKLIAARYPDAKRFACGFSLGGMILWNYLARCETRAEARMDSAMVVSSPWHSMATTVSLEQPFNCFIFNKGILRNCLKLVEPLKPMFVDRLNWDHLMASETMRHFDARFIAPLAGMGSVEEYYEATSLSPKVSRIPVPTLTVNAADDAFSPTHSIPFDDVCRSANVAVCLTAHGGHTAFMQGANPNDPGFIEKLIVQFGDAVFSDHFDARFIAPLAGMGSVEEYYEATSLAPKVSRIPVPTLTMNAADDAFSPTHSIPFHDVCRSANVAVCLTAHGGHTAFMQGANPNDPGFIEKLIVQFGDAVFSE